ncbi:type I methionyl aminopeptidase [Arsenicicoccus dermatophilus]|uniref:type I methionyl aminopeptidase n=1 Tax=Arsenicicoccus dermatophilus TaxID=1076331 RepID=UPI0039175800
MIEYKTPAEVQAMRPAGAFVAQVLHTLRSEVTVGTDLLDVDARVRELVEARGGVSCYVDYHPSFGGSPFGHYICTSVNDAVLHGLPHRYRLRDGDLVSLDLAVQVDGWVADSAVSFVVGQAAPQDLRLIETCERALAAAIDVAEVGNRIGDLSATIGQVAREAGYAVNTQFGGHGVGRTMHGEPHVPNDGRAGRGLVLRPGLVVAIEPWLMATTDRLVKDPDGWTLRSADGSRTAHAEHTVAITPDGPLVLTDRSHLA